MSRRRRALPKEPITTTIESLSHEGRGISHINGKTHFIHGALPKETIAFRLSKKNKNFCEGQTLEVIDTPHPDRTEPPCPAYTLCGGCSLQHMSMAAQLKLKADTLKTQMQHFGQTPINHELLPTLEAGELAYRRKARLGVRYVPGKGLLVGFRERNGRYITHIDHCPVLDERIGQRIEALKTLIQSLSCYDSIPQIEVAMGDHDAALIIRHLKALNDDDLCTLQDFGKHHQLQIYLQPNKPDPLYKCWPEDGCERLYYQLPKHQLTLGFHPSEFTQVNAALNQQMIDLALEHLQLSKQDHVLDLFCGIGNFSLPIALSAKQVTGIEGAQTAVERAQENAQANKINNAQFFLSDLFVDCKDKAWAQQRYDKVLLDPPRSGAENILSLLPQWQAKRIVYISCNPATLARDSGIITQQHGYTLEHCGIMNMFPHTHHVESIAVFHKEYDHG